MCAWREEGRVRRECEEAFLAADEEAKGFLSQEDYKVAILSLLGYKPSKFEVRSVWKNRSGTNGGSLSKEEFVSLTAQRIMDQDKDSLARQVFLAFDVCCQGFLSEKDCLRAVQSVAPHLATDRIPALFREVDWNGDRRVSYRDFELMMRYTRKEK